MAALLTDVVTGNGIGNVFSERISQLQALVKRAIFSCCFFGTDRVYCICIFVYIARGVIRLKKRLLALLMALLVLMCGRFTLAEDWGDDDWGDDDWGDDDWSRSTVRHAKQKRRVHSALERRLLQQVKKIKKQ